MIRRERQANSVQGRLNSIFRHIPGHIKMRNSVDGTIKTAGEWGLYYKQRNDHSTYPYKPCQLCHGRLTA